MLVILPFVLKNEKKQVLNEIEACIHHAPEATAQQREDVGLIWLPATLATQAWFDGRIKPLR